MGERGNRVLCSGHLAWGGQWRGRGVDSGRASHGDTSEADSPEILNRSSDLVLVPAGRLRPVDA